MKRILCGALVLLSVFLIYLSTIDRKVYFLTLSSVEKEPYYSKQIMKNLKNKNMLEKYVTGFNGKDYRVTDFTRMIQNNKTIQVDSKKQSIKNALIKADLVVLDIGKVDLFAKLAYESDEEVLYGYADTIAEDMKDLFEFIRLYCKEDIYLLEIYNPSNVFPKDIVDYMNTKMKKLAEDYKMHFVDYTINEDMVYDKIELNQKGEKVIYKKLQDMLSKTLFSK